MSGLPDNPLAGADPGGLRALAAAAGAFPLAADTGAFLFLRHGRTMGNIKRVYQHPDDPLSPEGFADADRAAAILTRQSFDRIAASDMARAWLTSGRVATATGRPVTAVAGLRERYFGALIGTPSAGLDWRAAPPGGESLEAFVSRAAAGVNTALAGAGSGRTLLVSHGGVLQVLAGMLGLSLAPELTHNALPLSFRRDGPGWTLSPLE
jgi:probable phosphoglycerate mutase